MKYQHALFLNPYIEKSSTSAMNIFPPTGLEYVARSAQGLVGKVTLLDLRHESALSTTEALLDFIRSEGVDIVCASIAWDRYYDEICNLLSCMPQNIPLVVGGYKATERVEELFERCPPIDIVVRGEGEETMQEIVRDLPWQDILGISYRTKGTVRHNNNRPLSDIDTIPSPDRSLRRATYRFALNGVALTNFTFDTVLSSRGCPYNCKFCTFSLNPLGQRRTYSERSVEAVVDEIESISASIILFSDENFGVNPQRAEALCDAIIARHIKKNFVAQTRIEVAQHPALLEKMVTAGFKTLLVGIESPHDRILAQLDKGFDSATIRRCFVVLKKYPILYHGYFIYGNIGETEEEMLYIAQFAKEIGVDSITFLKLRVEKFSPLRKIAEATPGYHVTDSGALYSDTYSHASLKKIGRQIKFSFYTPARFVKLVKKCFAVKLFTVRDVFSLLAVVPAVMKSLIARELQKKRFGDSLWRTFIRNA